MEHFIQAAAAKDRELRDYKALSIYLLNLMGGSIVIGPEESHSIIDAQKKSVEWTQDDFLRVHVKVIE